MVRTSRKIPNGWETYNSIGSVIAGTRMFAFKTPLLPELQKQISKTRRFTTIDLCRMLAANGQSLGLVVNCSNTHRYYDSTDIVRMTIGYKELLCPGRGFLVRSDLTKDFIKIIDEFLSQNEDNDLLIGIHCGDGINRSGYLICNYLICKFGWSSHDALNAFENARGYSIQRGSYIQALHKADSDRRNKRTDIAYAEDLQLSKPKKKNTKKKLSEEKIEGIHMSAQIMQELFQVEQQFKQVTESYEARHDFLVNPMPSSINSLSNIPNVGTSTLQLPYHSQSHDSTFKQTTSYEDSPNAGNTSDEDEDDNADDSSANIDFESMGRVDVKEPLSKSAIRRKRRQKREKIFSVMKKGRMWEINEMRNQLQK